MKSQHAKQNYYESLERQTRAESLLEKENEKDDREDQNALISFSRDDMYLEIGLKTYNVIVNILDILGGLGSGRQRPAQSSAERGKVMNGNVSEPLTSTLEKRLEGIEEKLDTILAGIKRIDKFTLDAFRNIDSISEEREALQRQVDQLTEALEGSSLFGSSSGSERIPKEETVDRALQAAQELEANGERLTLASIARKAGLKYSQVMYAFGNKEGFFAEYDQYKQANKSAS